MLIDINAIAENDFNKGRSMDPDEIALLALSIRENGLYTPLMVFKDKKGNYKILSGHKRLHAMRLLGFTQIECDIKPEPDGEIKEKEMMLQANMHRSGKEAMLNEVAIANAVWDRMPQSLQNEYAEKFREEFIRRYPDKDIKEFRPKHEYIMHMTGITDKTYRTIQNYVNEAETLKAMANGEIEDEKPQKTKKSKPKMKHPRKLLDEMKVALEFLISGEQDEYVILEDTQRQIRKIIQELGQIIDTANLD